MNVSKNVKEIISNAPELPGVYRFLDGTDKILYIGKAKNLKNRLYSYLSVNFTNNAKIFTMLQRASSLEYIITKTEEEALILEAKFIRAIKPKFNTLLKDESSMSFIKINIKHQFPGVYTARRKSESEDLFIGPFISNKFIFNIVNELIKLFKIRNCSNEYFAARKKPCLQYQIGRCSAPCVKKISPEDYKFDLQALMQVINGKSKAILNDLNKEMKRLSHNLEYEKAAKVRDLSNGIQLIANKYRSEFDIKNADVISCAESSGVLLVQIFTYRMNQFLGNKTFFFNKEDLTFENNFEMYEAFIWQYYHNNEIPEEIIIDQDLNLQTLRKAISDHFHSNINIFYPKRGDKYKAILFAQHHGSNIIKEHLKQNTISEFKLKRIQELFQLPNLPKRIEVYDNSHIMGKYPIGAMIVLIDGKFCKSEYRRYHITLDKFGGDDYGMLEEVINRRCKRMLVSNNYPDLMIIDGGKGHLSVAKRTIKKHNINVPVISIAKGEFRNKGNERFFFHEDFEPITLNNSDPVMQYLQIMRDEAHNVAISTHRKLRNKSEIGLENFR